MALVLAAIAPARAGGVPHYDLTLIPVESGPGGMKNIFGVINDKGLIAGFHADWHKTPKLADSFTAALYDGRTFRALPTFGGAQTVVYAMNAEGDLAGTSDTPGGKAHAFLYRNAYMRDLGTLGGDTSTALAVNDDDIVVGESDAADGSKHAFVWRDGTISDLNDLLAPDATLFGGDSYTLASATAINGKGDVILWARTGSGGYAPLLLRLNKLSEIKPPASWGPILSAASLKDDGSFAGSFKAPDGHEEAFVFSHGMFQDMGTLAAASRAYAVNAGGYAVGESQAADNGSRAVLWTGQGLVDLNALFDDDARTKDGITYRLAVATGIDSKGRIVGVAWEDAADPHDAVFILTPAHGLGFWALLSLALAAAVAAALALFAYAHPSRFHELAAEAALLARRSVPSVGAANAAQIVALAGHWLLGIAVFEALAFLVLWIFGTTSPTVFADPLVFGICGAFLIRRRSGAVAAFALLYAVAGIVLALALSAGFWRSAITVVFALAAAHASWQALRAAGIDRRSRGLKTRWSNVALVSAATFAAFAALAALFAFAASRAGLSAANSNVAALITMAALSLALFAVMVPLSARRPFSGS